MKSLAGTILGALGALFLVTSSMACGGENGEDPNSSSAFQEICQVQASCLDDQFDKQYGTVNGCAEALKANADLSNKSGECLRATRKTFECQADNVQCMNNEIAYDDACEAEAEAQATACSDYDFATAEDYREYCNFLRDCLGESTFGQAFDDIDACVTQYENDFAALSLECKKLGSDMVKCDNEHQECQNGQIVQAQECSEEYSAFESQCGG